LTGQHAVNLRSLVAHFQKSHNDHDLDALREVYDEDVDCVVDGVALHGVDAVLGYVTDVFREFPRLRIHETRIVAESGDTIVVEHQILNGDPSGGPLRPQGSVCGIYRARDGRIVAHTTYYMAEGADREDGVNVPSRAEGGKMAEEQAALRRVATLVARGVAQDEVFAAVNEEVGWLVAADPTSLMRFEADDTVTLVAAWSAADAAFPIGARRPVDDELRSLRDDGRALRFGPMELPPDGPFVEEARRLAIRSAVGVPIVVDGRVWGAAFAASTREVPFPQDTETRLTQFTELVAMAIANAESRVGLARLAEEQTALRRVATLVAQGVPPEEVFAAVAEEVVKVLPVQGARIGRYEADTTVTYVATTAEPGAAGPAAARLMRAGQNLALGGNNLATLVFETGRPARLDNFDDISGPIGTAARGIGTGSAVGAPIVVEGRLWGVASAGWTLEQPLPPDTGARLTDFTELVATAIANAENRAGLAASRARIVAAADESSRRIQRDLHDGAQQRLVHTVVVQQLALRAFENGDANVGELMLEALQNAQQANLELRELAQGVLPSLLTREGLHAAVDALVSRISLPVSVDMSVGRLPTGIEATAYFVVSEALTNVVKHARASAATVGAWLDGGQLRVEIGDDGIGGAHAGDSTGLRGLDDRVSALDGRLVVESVSGQGTVVRALLPIPDPS
jgi:signal transduction histidine kinase/limonene-1,2-epoxide hydrolase